jgi:hypothetical protein
VPVLHRPLVVTVLAAVAVLAAGLATGAAPSSAAEVPTTARPAAARPVAGVAVSPDPAHDLYVGTGGLLVPSRSWRSGGGRGEAAGCLGCEWRVSVLCTKAEFAAGTCVRIDVGCPVGEVPVRIWLRHPGGDWAVVGRACQGGDPPRTVAQVGAEVRDRAQAALPPLRARVQPAAGTLVTVPAVFRTGQPAAGIRGADLSVLGLDVRLNARVRWLWSYGDGSSGWTSRPGGVYPDVSVSHAYAHAGSVTAQVSAVWRGEYVVEGLGPFAVPGDPLVQSAAVTVVVRSAHARLVG